MASVQLTEIFLSLQGEGLTTGLPTIFVRLTGCPLRCSYCDTEYAFYGGKKIPVEEIVAKVTAYGIADVLVTGGEPLAQKNALPLIRTLCDADLRVGIETSGALPIAKVDPRATIILDVKTPDSGEVARNLPENFDHLKPGDQVKFVISSREDYLWSRDFLREHQLSQRCHVLFSPNATQLAPRQLADWIVDDQLPVRLQLQLHKLLWGDEPGR